MKQLSRILAISGLAMVGISNLAAAPVYDTYIGAANFTGSRSTIPVNDGLDGTGNWNTGDFSISWNITYNAGTQLYTYTYTFNATTGTQGGISHWILDLSDNCTSATDRCVISPTPGGTLTYGTYDGSDPSNPGLPGSITGVKFDYGLNLNSNITFTSTRLPVWGDFYAKDGNAGGQGQNAVWNQGVNNHASTNIIDFIARPDTAERPPDDQGDVPEPGTIALLGTGLALIAASKFRRS